MKDYLDQVTPDYIGETLTVSPQGVMVHAPLKEQEVHEGDDGSEERISFGDDWTFAVSINMELLTETENSTLMDLYLNDAKADGILWTFPWYNPHDGNTYTARFDSILPWSVNAPKIYGISEVKLKVLGYYL